MRLAIEAQKSGALSRADIWRLTCKIGSGRSYEDNCEINLWYGEGKKFVDRNWVTLRMSGRLEAEHLGETQNALADEGTHENLALALRAVTVIAREAVRFLAHVEVNRNDLHERPTYVRDWIAQERRAMRRRG